MPHRRDAWFRTLRFRLAFWNTAVILLLAIFTLLGVWVGLRLTLLGELDHKLAGDAAEVMLILRETAGNPGLAAAELDRKARSQEGTGWFVCIDGPSGRLMAAADTPPPLPDPSGPPDPASVPGYRLVTRDLGSGVVVQVGSRTDDVERDLARLTELLLVAGLLLLVVVPVSGYWLAGRATRPLADIIRTAGRLRPSQFHERLPIRGTGDELDRLSRTINGFLDRLAEYLTRKGDFLANAAHELRSPLAAIRASAEVSLHSERPAEEYRDLLGEIVERCDDLSALVNQLLLLAEGDAGRLQPGEGRLDLCRLATRAVDMFHGVAESRGVSLVAEVPATVSIAGEATHLRQVVHNLIDNAIKYTPAGGSVCVSLWQEGGRAVLSVRDTGSGIAAEDLPRVFERFYRCDKSRGSSGGRPSTGLGLSICQAIVEAYGGTLKLDSAPGRGTEARVELPTHH